MKIKYSFIVMIIMTVVLLNCYPKYNTIVLHSKRTASTSTNSVFLPPNPIAGDAYAIGGGGTATVTPSGVPLSDASMPFVGAPNQLFSDANGDIFFRSNDGVDMAPTVSGTYFGINMIKGDIYRIAGTGQTPNHTSTIQFGSSALNIANMGVLAGVDGAGDVFVEGGGISGTDIAMIPIQSGTYFGTSMTADYIYPVLGNGQNGQIENDVPALSVEYKTSCPDGNPNQVQFTVDSSGNLYLLDGCAGNIVMVPQVSGTYFGVTMQADYAYIVAGNSQGSSSSCTGQLNPIGVGGPALSATLCALEPITVVANGILYIDSGYNGYMVPSVSGTYYGQSMTADNLYEINASSSGSSNNRTDVLNVDSNGDFMTDNYPIDGYVPATSGTYFGQNMIANHTYQLYGSSSNGLCKYQSGLSAFAMGYCTVGGISFDPYGNICVLMFGETGIYIAIISKFESTSTNVPNGPSYINTIIPPSTTNTATLSLSWPYADPNGSPITDYIVTENNLTTGATPSTIDMGSITTSFTPTNLVAGDTYQFSVQGVNANGRSTPVVSLPITYLSNFPQPYVGSITYSSNSATVEIGNLTIISAFDIILYNATDPSSATVTHVVGNGSTSDYYTFNNLVPGDIYCASANLENSSGDYGPSNSDCFTAPSVPSAPFPPSLSLISGGMALSWSSTNFYTGELPITGYNIQVNNETTATSSVISVSNVTSYNVTGLIAGDLYDFNISSVNQLGSSNYSYQSNSMIVGAPSPPLAVSALGGSGTVDVLWAPPVDTGASPLSDYIVTEYVNNNPPITIDTGSTSTILILNNLNITDQYSFSIQASNSYGNSLMSEVSNVTIPANEPGSPSEITSIGNISSGLTFSWLYPTQDPLGVTGYQMNFCNTIYNYNTTDPYMLLPPWPYSTLPPACSYTIPLASIDNTYFSTPTILSSSISTNSSVLEMPPFSPDPTGIDTPITGGVQFNMATGYNDSSGDINPISYYLIYVMPSVGSSYPIFTTNPNYTLTGLSATDSYKFMIFYGNSYGWSLPLITADPIPLAGVPFAVTNLTASYSSNAINLSFSAPNDNGSAISDYIIVESNGTTIDTKSTSTNYSVTNLVPGDNYSFQVEAVNSYGTSALSNETTPITVGTGLSVVSVSPNSGYLLGTNQVTINGTNLSGTTAIYFGKTLATSFNIVSNTQITAVVPAGTAPGVVDITLEDAQYLSGTSSSDQYTYLQGGVYYPVVPTRICDTRKSQFANQCNNNSLGAPLNSNNETLNVSVVNTNNDQVPATATAVIVNVTAVNPTATSYLTVYPTGTTEPNSSNLNFTNGDWAVANSVEVKLGTNGQISISNYTGSVDILVDVEGYIAPAGSTVSGLYNPISPFRLVDTRKNATDPSTYANQTFSANQTQSFKVTGVSSVPSTNISAVAINITATDSSSYGFISVAQSNFNSTPSFSDLNFSPGSTNANTIVVPVSSTGMIYVYSSAPIDVVIDISGFYSSNGTDSTGFYYYPINPTRIVDSRPNSGFQYQNQPLTGGANLTLGTPKTVNPINAYNDQIPNGALAVSLNITATNNPDLGFLSIYPTGNTAPDSSNLNWTNNKTVANLAIATLSQAGTFNIAANVTTDFIVDVNGYYGL